MSGAERMLRELVAIPSVNPAYAADPRWAGEQRVGEFLAAQARRAGLEVEWRPVLAGRSNLLVRLAPRGRVRRRVLLAPHLDTVGGDLEAGELFRPRVRAGRLYGRGACDTKGSVAAMFGALLQLVDGRRTAGGTEIVFAGLADEECGQTGSRALAREGFKADLAVVGEPTRLQLVTAHKGVLWLGLRTRGKAAHGSRPELGRNAVHSMAKVVDVLETDYAALLRRRRHPLLGHATVNVGVIRGGRQPNIVPEECVIQIDRRTLPGERDPRVVREMVGLLRERGLRVEAFRAHNGAMCRPLETGWGLELVQELARCLGQKAPAGVMYFSDAAVLADGGIPSVLFGPGDIAQAHRPDEWVSLRQLDRAQHLLHCFLRSLG